MEPFDPQAMYCPPTFSAYNYYQYHPDGSQPPTTLSTSLPNSNQVNAGPGPSTSHRDDDNPESGDSRSYVYYVKPINPRRKEDFVVRHWHGVNCIFKSSEALRKKLAEFFPSEFPPSKGIAFQIGFFEPPNNSKRWNFDDRDLTVMYSALESGSKINLWCETSADQTLVEADKIEPSAKRKKNTSRDGIEDELDAIFKQLKEKHPEKGSPALRLWAKLIQNGRWDNYDSPPPIPLITGGEQNGCKSKKNAQTVTNVPAGVFKKVLQPNLSSPPTSEAKKIDSVVTKISLMKTATVRRSCLEDLKRLKELLDEHVLTEEEFLQEKRQILSTLKSLK